MRSTVLLWEFPSGYSLLTSSFNVFVPSRCQRSVVVLILEVTATRKT